MLSEKLFCELRGYLKLMSLRAVVSPGWTLRESSVWPGETTARRDWPSRF